MAVEVKRTSRLILGELKSLDSVEFWDILDLPAYVPQPADVEHLVQDGQQIDLIAQFYYQDPVLWWVIAWANDLEIIPTQLNQNDKLLIPDPVFVKTKLLRGLFRQGL